MNVLGALPGLTNCKRGLYAVAVLVCATVLVALGHLSTEYWGMIAIGSQGIHAWATTVRPTGAPASSVAAAAAAANGPAPAGPTAEGDGAGAP